MAFKLPAHLHRKRYGVLRIPLRIPNDLRRIFRTGKIRHTKVTTWRSAPPFHFSSDANSGAWTTLPIKSCTAGMSAWAVWLQAVSP